MQKTSCGFERMNQKWGATRAPCSCNRGSFNLVTAMRLTAVQSCGSSQDTRPLVHKRLAASASVVL